MLEYDAELDDGRLAAILICDLQRDTLAATSWLGRSAASVADASSIAGADVTDAICSVGSSSGRLDSCNT